MCGYLGGLFWWIFLKDFSAFLVRMTFWPNALFSKKINFHKAIPVAMGYSSGRETKILQVTWNNRWLCIWTSANRRFLPEWTVKDNFDAWESWGVFSGSSGSIRLCKIQKMKHKWFAFCEEVLCSDSGLNNLEQTHKISLGL